MTTNLSNAEDAIALIRSHSATGGRVLGIDGLEFVRGGIIGRIDLVLDLSSRPMSPAAAEAEAIEFVEANRADNIVFDVVVDRSKDG